MQKKILELCLGCPWTFTKGRCRRFCNVLKTESRFHNAAATNRLAAVNRIKKHAWDIGIRARMV